ncbi:Hypothetical Protein FCC1311_075722 [Hondaea fermentalgiana]|uniref:Uncharacterized protein n=1 Tax=Hondaea fermentalgiana TaxID=2315210 RepID=A0A2R5GNM8_9STRA|nr:Hypothetical Protein FCC1311_075722 [Hondaea fermentalgiana]|eukprot:GBG31348.1 Hypothetical Protein FCC1311_075722 [Hondaea fermentalgiana]
MQRLEMRPEFSLQGLKTCLLANAMSANAQARAPREEDPEWRKKLKMKSATSLKLGLCLDPRTVDECMDLQSKKGRMWRVMRAKQMQQAHHRDAEKFEAWRDRIEHFSPKNEEAVKRVRAKHSGPKDAEAEASLPSKTLWHYYYHGGKTRAERRTEATQRIAEMRREQEAKLEARREGHKKRLAAFAKRGLARREMLAQRRKEQQRHLRLPVVPPEVLATKAAQQEHLLMEKEARQEAAIQIQAVIRGGLARVCSARQRGLAANRGDLPEEETNQEEANGHEQSNDVDNEALNNSINGASKIDVNIGETSKVDDSHGEQKLGDNENKTTSSFDEDSIIVDDKNSQKDDEGKEAIAEGDAFEDKESVSENGDENSKEETKET